MTDYPLDKTQIIWGLYEPKTNDPRPPAKLCIIAQEDDRDYIKSWGACNGDFNDATAEVKLEMLFRQFVHMTAIDGEDPDQVHALFMQIPEYRKALAAFGSINPSLV